MFEFLTGALIGVVLLGVFVGAVFVYAMLKFTFEGRR